jgi:MFS family permease
MGWRWIWRWSAIFLGINLLAFIFLYEETKYTVSIEGLPARTIESAAVQNNKDEEKQTNLVRRVTVSIDSSIPQKSYWQRMALWTTSEGDWRMFLHHFYQPLVILVTFPAVSYTALQYGAALAWYSVVGVSRSTYFPKPPYNFSTMGIGLLNLAPFIGCILAPFISGLLSDWSIQYFAKRNNGVYEPEMRLYVIIIPTVLVPVGLFLYGYSLAEVIFSTHHNLNGKMLTSFF